MEATDAAKAERLSKRRAKNFPSLALLLVAQQVSYFTKPGAGRQASDLHIAAWLVLSVIILAVLTTGGGWIYSGKVRRLANDEGTRVHRDRSFRVGFLASMITCVVLYFASAFEPLSAREAIHFVMTSGIAVAVLWFAYLERRAHRGD